MPYTDAAKHRMLDSLAGGTPVEGPITQVGLYTDAGATTEVTGGTYARQALTFTAAGSEAPGRVDHGAVTFDVPAGTTVSSVGYLDADGTLMAYADVTDETFAQDGQYQITDASYLDLNG